MNFATLGLSNYATRQIGLPASAFDTRSRTISAVIARGNPIPRPWGTERLRIGMHCITFARLRSVGIPLIDSHRTDTITRALGKLETIAVERGAVVGRIRLFASEAADRVAALIASGKVALSLAYSMEGMIIYDRHNREVNPSDTERASEADLVFEMSEWTPVELSLVRADANAGDLLEDRAYVLPVEPEVADAFERMVARQMMTVDHHQRQSGPRRRPEIDISIFNHESDADEDGPYRRVVMPDRNLVFYRPPGT
jgi:hypothetical protein